MAEALSTEEAPGGSYLIPTMQEIAAEEHVPFMTLHETVLDHQDAGFFFWDVVHPTSFGHKRIAQALVPFLEAHLTPRAPATWSQH